MANSLSSLFFIIIFIFFFFITPSLSDPRSTTAALICSNRTASLSDRSAFITNFLSALDAVTPQISSQRFARVVRGTTANNSVYAFGQCMRDLSQSDCDLCFAICKTQIPRCLPFQLARRGGRNFLDGCYLRYDDYNFFGEVLSQEDRTVCNGSDFNGNRMGFVSNSVEMLKNLSVEAPKNNGFFVGSAGEGNSTIYGLAQCWEFVNGSSCARCLENAVHRIRSCLPKEEGRVLNSGCYLRYSLQKFYYNSSSSDATGGNGGHRLVIILATVSSSLVAVMVVARAICCQRTRFAQRRNEKKILGALVSTIKRSELNFKYETLEKATNYFHNSNKLGQGGSGSVFKGILPDGRTVAIKRLFFNTRQWVDEFFNEVNLISGVHHKNLVKLLGCSITGPESLLVYEYVPNQSLHHHLHDENKARRLSWHMRCNILVETAEGLAYLHEESKLRIIHRDIKLGNILLDDDFIAKIADFGLARFFPEDRTHITTAIAGTPGYMAPEYLVRGQLTEKADVYSYGVLLIEVICGKRNNFNSSPDPLSTLQTVWILYTSSRLPEAVDPTLQGEFQGEDVSRVLQIGLLCTQASAELRPSMSTVVTMLTGNHPIPSPTQPPFVNPNSVITIRSPKTYNSRNDSSSQYSENSMTVSLMEPR